MFSISLLIYFIIILILSVFIFRHEKKNQSGESAEFWTGGGRISGYSLGFSISATMMSISWSVVYGSQLFYQFGYGALWLLGIPWLMTLAFFWRLAPWLRRQKVFSQPELLGRAFGSRFKTYSALVLSLVFLTWAAGEIYAAGNILAPLLNISPLLAMFLISVMIAIYSLLGGFSAVIATDKIQFGFVVLFMILIVYLGLEKLDMPFLQLFDAPQKIANSGFSSPGWPLIILTFFAYLPGWFVETDIWLRIQAAKTDAEARKGAAIAWVNALLFVIIMPMLLGFLTLSWSGVDAKDPVTSLISQIINDSSIGIFGQLFLFLGLISAAMSTIDTNTNIVALSIGSDIIESQRELIEKYNLKPIRIARLTTLCSVTVAFIYAVYTDSLWDIFYLSSGLLTTAIAIPVILALRGEKNKQAAWYASVSGIVFTLLFFFLERSDLFQSIYPQWLVETQLGYLIWGLLGSVGGYLVGKRQVKSKK